MFSTLLCCTVLYFCLPHITLLGSHASGRQEAGHRPLVLPVIRWSADRPAGRCAVQPTNWANQPGSQSAGQPTSWLAIKATTQAVKQLANQSDNEPAKTHQPVTPGINQPAGKAANQTASRPTNQTSRRYVQANPSEVGSSPLASSML